MAVFIHYICVIRVLIRRCTIRYGSNQGNSIVAQASSLQARCLRYDFPECYRKRTWLNHASPKENENRSVAEHAEGS